MVRSHTPSFTHTLPTLENSGDHTLLVFIHTYTHTHTHTLLALREFLDNNQPLIVRKKCEWEEGAVRIKKKEDIWEEYANTIN